MLDIEFTIEKGILYILQTRSGKRTGFSAVNIAIDMVDEGLINQKEAVMRVEPEHLEQLLSGVFDRKAKKAAMDEGRLLTKGLNAGPGAASGKVVFTAEKAVDMVQNKREKVILVRKETSAEDIAGMSAAEGILTSRGGMTSHAAVVARGMGKSCIVGASELDVDYEKKAMWIGDRKIEMGDHISIDGTTGEVILGELPVLPSEIYQVLIEETIKPEDSKIYRNYAKLLTWADSSRRLKIRTNADTPEDAGIARSFGAEGIGLCRTEHMFFAPERIKHVREMIIAENVEERRKAVGKLKDMQREDFIGIFRAMAGLPVTIRLIDPPLHEFLPADKEAIAEFAKEIGVPLEKVHNRIDDLEEANPMLGHRGVRLVITYPEIYEMQVEAILEAAAEVLKDGHEVYPEIMIPLVGTLNEIKAVKYGRVEEGSPPFGKSIHEIAEDVMLRKGIRIPFLLGTMIEIPRAALRAAEIAEEAEFFSFGTNDLTQMTYGFSRDDAGRSFLPDYKEKGVITDDPFKTLDQDGVGELVRIGVERGRSTRKDLKVGICGEHGGDPESITFCHNVGLDYVSCSGFRVPIARLSAAKAALLEESSELGDPGAQ
jgi:pyruvate,orthophosphate dikinase